jgi:integrase
VTEGALKALKAYIGMREKGLVFQPWWAEQNPCVSAIQGRWYGTWRDFRNGAKCQDNCLLLGPEDQMSRATAERKFEAELKRINLNLPETTRPLTEVAMSKAVRTVGVRAGLKNVCPQMLRRAFATHLYNNGARPEIIQALMGHVFYSTTANYVRISAGKVEKHFRQAHPRGQMHVQDLPQNAPANAQ